MSESGLVPSGDVLMHHRSDSMVVPLGLEDPGMRCGVDWRSTWSRRRQPALANLPKVRCPPAGCAGVVCANETNKKENQVACLFFVADRGGGAGEEGGGVIHSTQHTRSSHKI